MHLRKEEEWQHRRWAGESGSIGGGRHLEGGEPDWKWEKGLQKPDGSNVIAGPSLYFGISRSPVRCRNKRCRQSTGLLQIHQRE